MIGIENINAANIITGTINSSYLSTSNINSTGNYGNSSNLLALNIDIYGRITTISNILNTDILTKISDASTYTTGTLNVSRLESLNNVSGIYGSTTNTISLSIDNYGRIISISNVKINLTSTSINELASSATIDTTNASNITDKKINVNRLPSVISASNIIGNGTGLNSMNASNIISGILSVSRYPSVSSTTTTYRSSTNSLSINIDSYGRITNVTNVSLSFVDIVNISNATNYTQGTLNTSILSLNSINGNFGSISNILSITVDTYGRITSISNNIINIATTKVSGLATSATIDTTSATNITSGKASLSFNQPITATFSGSALGINGYKLTNITISTINSSIFPNSGIIGSTINVSNSSFNSLIVDSYGRITSIIPISPIIDASTITTGTLNVSRLPLSGVVSGNYGSALNTTTLSIDNYGRIISATNTAIRIPYTSITGLPSTTTLDITNIVSIGISSNINLSIGNITQPITLHSSNLNINNNYLFNQYNNYLYNFPVYKYKTFNSILSLSIPTKYSNTIEYDDYYNGTEVNIYLKLDSANTTDVIFGYESTYLESNQNHFIGSGASPQLYNSTDSVIIRNISNIDPNLITININNLDNQNSAIYYIESLSRDITNGVSRSYSTGYINNPLTNNMTITIGDVSGSFSGYYTTLDYY